MKIRFEPGSKYFRIRCNETMEERDFSTLEECIAFADRGRQLMPEEPVGYVITKITEQEADY